MSLILLITCAIIVVIAYVFINRIKLMVDVPVIELVDVPVIELVDVPVIELVEVPMIINSSYLTPAMAHKLKQVVALYDEPTAERMGSYDDLIGGCRDLLMQFEGQQQTSFNKQDATRVCLSAVK